MASRGRNPRVAVKSTFDDKGTKKAEGALTRLNSAGKRSFGGLSKSALGYGAALVGGAGVVGGLEAVIGANADAEASQAKVEQMLKNAGLSWSKYGDHIDRVIQKQSRLTGLDDEELAESFANFVRTTKDVNKALELNALAADLARTKGMGLAQAQSLIARVYNGSFTGLKRLGIAIDPVTTAQDRLKASTKKASDEQVRAAKEADKLATRQKAIGLLQESFGGQAKRYGETQRGAMDRFRVAVENLEEKLGGALAPTVTNVANKAAKFVNQMEAGTGAGGRFAHQMGDVAHKVGDVVEKVAAVAKWLKDHPRLLAVAGAAWVTYKVGALAEMAVVKAAALGLFGPGVQGKMKRDAAGAGSAVGKQFAAKAGAVAAAGIAGWEIGKWLRDEVPAVRDAGDFIGEQLGEAIFGGSKLQEKVDQIVDKLKDVPSLQSSLNTVTGQINQGFEDVTGKRSRPRRKSSGLRPNAHKTSVTSSRARASSAVASSASNVLARAAGGSVTGDIGGLNPSFLAALRSMSAGTGRAIFVQDGKRSLQEQAVLYEKWQNGTGNRAAAPNANAPHVRGIAADITPGREVFGGVASQYGLAFTVADESWHIELAGAGAATTTSATAKAAPKPTPKPKSAFEKLENRLGYIGLEVEAGVISEAAGDKRTIAAVTRALPKLRGSDRLRALAERRGARSDQRDRAREQRERERARREARAQERADYAERKAGFYDRSLSNPFLQAYLDHQDYRVAKGEISQAEADAIKANALRGAISSGQLSEADVVAATGQIDALTPKGPGAVADEAARLEDIDLHARAGDYDAAAAAAGVSVDEYVRRQKVASIQDALTNWQGLTDQERLELRAELGDLTNAITDNTAVMQQQNDILREQNANLQNLYNVAQTEERVLGRALAQTVAQSLGVRIGMGIQTPTLGVQY